MIRWHHLVGALVVLAASWLGSSAGQAGKVSALKPLIPEAAGKELVHREVKLIEGAIDSDDKKVIARAKVGALLLLAYARSIKFAGDSPETPEDIALARAYITLLPGMLGKQEERAETKKIIGYLKDIKSAPKLKSQETELDVDKVAGTLAVMRPYNFKSKGGDGVHEALFFNAKLKNTNGGEELLPYLAKKELAAEKLAPAAKELALFGYQAAMLGVLTAACDPGAKKGPDGVTPWSKFSAMMRDGGVSLAEAAQKKDTAGVQQASETLNNSCLLCHKEYR